MKELVHRLDLEDIYVLPIGGRWMLFSPRNMTSAIVNRAAVEAIIEYAVDDKSTVPKTIKDLWHKLSRVPITTIPSQQGPEKLVIIPTRECNMRCVYCDFGASSANATILDPRLACRLVDHVAEKLAATPGAILGIHFFGGEPMIAQPCVETIIHYANMVCSRKGLTPWYEITTNGYFNHNAIPFIGDYVDYVVISIDGDKPFHDFNRQRGDGSGTYAIIAENIKRLGRFPVKLSLRACITNRSVNAMLAIASHFCSEFEFDVLCFEMMAETEFTSTNGLCPPDPNLFAAGILQAESIAADHGVQVINGPSELYGPRTTSCPVGLGTLMLNPDGILTACYLEVERWTRLGIDPVVGYVGPVSGPKIEQQKLDAIPGFFKQKPRCVRCFCRYTCAGGCHINQTPPGCSLEYNDRCRATRLITAGRLLRNLKETATEVSFLEQPSVMKYLAENADDRLSTWASDSTQREI